MPREVQATFVSQKINKIRWIPEEYVKSEYFLTGSWDDDNNAVKVWTIEKPDDIEVENIRQVSEFPVQGDVTEIKFIESNRIAVSSSDGNVRVLEIDNYQKQSPLKEIYSWNKLHSYGQDPCSCTCLAALDNEVATGGEDGNINILNCRRGEVTSSVKSEDGCSIHCVSYIKYSQIMTGNIRGHMKIWDIQTPNIKPASSFLLSGDEQAATSLVHHPTQPHIIIAGSESGAIAIWDLRHSKFPTSLITAHSSAVTEIQFHPENPQKLLTASQSGEIWDWDLESISKSQGNESQLQTWIPMEDKSKLKVTPLMSTLHKSVNSIHCEQDRVLCAADNEAVYLIINYKY